MTFDASAPRDAPASAATGSDADAPAIQIACGSGNCDGVTNQCCLALMNLATACQPLDRNDNCATCDGPEDCAPGQVCCNGFPLTHCSNPGECDMDSHQYRWACRADSDCPSVAPHCCGPTELPLEESQGQHTCSAIDCAVACAGLDCGGGQCCPERRDCLTASQGVWRYCFVPDAGP